VVRSLDPPIRWSLLYTNAGTPPGETGKGTIRLHHLAPGFSLADTSYEAWSDASTLMDYLHGEPAVFGWSGSEQLRFGGMDLLGGFTAWGPIYQGIALTKINWSGEDFTLSLPSVVSVDEYRSPARDVELSYSGGSAGSRQVEFVIKSPGEIEARLEVFDVAGRRRAELITGRLAAGTRVVAWPLGTSGERAVENGVYYARLAFPGGVRTATVVVSR
jgi:hypothetical protein